MKSADSMQFKWTVTHALQAHVYEREKYMIYVNIFLRLFFFTVGQVTDAS